MKTYTEWELKWKRDLDFWFSDRGQELHLCLVTQGYKVNVFSRLTILLGSGFSAVRIIKNLEGEINKN